MNAEESTKRRGPAAVILDAIEWAGNKLPDPVTLFIAGALVVMVISQIAENAGWMVEKTVSETVVIDDQTVVRPRVEEVRATGLLTRDGLEWAISSMVNNFVTFPPLGVVLVGMLGIGVAEKTGAIGAVLKAFMLITPKRLLTPALVFIGIMSSAALDAGYVVLPPIAAALYMAVGRSPIAGVAAVFSGIGAGFSANLFVTGLDPLLAGFTETGARILDPTYKVAPTCNWWFMIASTILLTLTGWAVSSWFVEPRLARKSPEEGGPRKLPADHEDTGKLTKPEIKGLTTAGLALAATMAVILTLIITPGAPLYTYHMPDPANPDVSIIAELHGLVSAGAEVPANAVVDGDRILVPSADRFDRWIGSIVPLLFFVFVIPGLIFGIVAGTIKSDRDLAKLMGQTMADMGPYVVMAFFAAQFIAYFNHSHLGEMLAIVGGQALASADMPRWLLISSFILIVIIGNLFIGSASGKYAFLAPVFVPMFMAEGVNVSPELTQAAYRVGDSVSNTIAPLNPYIVIVMVFIQRYVPKAGIGTLVSLMLPYTVVFTIIWTLMLVVWLMTGVELGPGGGLDYVAPTAP